MAKKKRCAVQPAFGRTLVACWLRYGTHSEWTESAVAFGNEFLTDAAIVRLPEAVSPPRRVSRRFIAAEPTRTISPSHPRGARGSAVARVEWVGPGGLVESFDCAPYSPI